jgi:hypothetical protein
MAYPTVTGLQGLPDFAVTYNWDLSFVVSPAAVSGFPSTGIANELNLRCESSDIPRKASQSSTIMIRGLSVKNPGIVLPTQQINLSFVETADNMLTTLIYDWREACFKTDTGVASTKADLVATIQLVRNDRQGNRSYQYTLTGCYLEAYDPGGSFQGQSGEPMRVSISLSYDDFTEGSLF